MHITPDARLDDGLLDVTVIGAMSRPEFLVNFPKVFKGTHVDPSRRCTTFRGEHVELASLDASIPMDVYADGERVGPLPATMEAVRDALDRPRPVSRVSPRRCRRRRPAGCPPSAERLLERDRSGRSTVTVALHARRLVAGDRAVERVVAGLAEERDAAVGRAARRSARARSNSVVGSCERERVPGAPPT